MKKILYPPKSSWAQLSERAGQKYEDLHEAVKPILNQVKEEGDAALRKFVKRFDDVWIENFRVSHQEFEEANRFVSDELKKAIQVAKYNIAKFHIAQKETLRKIETMEGVSCWRKSTPIEKIGLYIPSQSAPLFSTILMLGIPANMAGCEDIVLCSTPNKDGTIHPVILYTANLLNIKHVFKAGGAQAIAAMAYGTESIPQVYKIFGPSNQYVTAAKQLVSEEGVAIDMTAGPSELLVIADQSANPVFVAADLLSQAEHGKDSQVILAASSENFVDQVLVEMSRQLRLLPRQHIASQALEKSRAIVFQNNLEALEFSNMYAPEHLIISTTQDDILAERVMNAGSVFLGPYSPESVGDYASGTNHTLPTEGFARTFSGVSLDSFVKKITFQKLTAKGICNIGRTVEIMAEAEGLQAHKNAVTVRLEALKNGI
ncbi:MAG: histidinol dehydrogenase [Microscillaceae bacterium]|nr:histidinol dehydrogenase [Microscillaceae bacterium]